MTPPPSAARGQRCSRSAACSAARSRALLRAAASSRSSASAGGRCARAPRSCPAALPRCLVRRLRFVWAMVLRSLVCAGVAVGRERPRCSRLLATGRSAGKPSNAAAGASPTSSARAGAAWRRDRRDHLARAASRRCPRRSSRPARRRGAASHRPIARTPGSPSAPPSRISAAIACASSSVAGGGELDVEGDQRRARGDQHRAGGRVQARRAEVGRQLAGCDPLGESCGPPRRSSARVRPPAELAVQEHRQLELARRAGRRAPAPRRRRRRGRRRRGRRSARRRARRRAGGRPRARRRRSRSTAIARAGERRRSPASPGAPASVNTLRWWSGSVWTSSRPRRRTRRRSRRSSPRSRPSETLGTASSVVGHASDQAST